MTTDFRALCVELVRIADALDRGTPLIRNQGQALDGYSALAAFRAIANRARAALSEPEPEGPTDEELSQLYCELFSLQSSPTSLGTAPARFARAVLAKYGNQPS